MALTALVAVLVFAGTALADDAHKVVVQGADYHASGSALESGEVDVATVAGAKDDMVFVSVSQEGVGDIAKYIPYTLGEGETRGSGSNWTGIVSLDISTLDATKLDGVYTISIYEKRGDKTALYQGKLYGVYADLSDLPAGDPDAQKLIGTRVVGTTDSADRKFVANDTLYVGGKTYRLVSTEPAADGEVLHFAYEPYNEATTVDGVVKYVDKAGNVVASTKVPGLAQNESRVVNIPTAVKAENGDVYRTVFFRDSVEMKNPGSTSYTIPCTMMSADEAAAANHYVATIQLVDEGGKVIATDSVNVTGEFRYTAPTNIYKRETVGGEQVVFSYEVAEDPVLNFNAATDEVVSGAKTVQVKYNTLPADQAEAKVTFYLIDGSKPVKSSADSDRSLGKTTVVVNEANKTAQPPTQVEHNGTTYNLVGSPEEYEYAFRSNQMPIVNAYYLPEGYQVEDKPYEVTVEYVNFLTGETIDSESFESNPATRVDINAPAEFSLNGVDYVRLDGQEEITHSYYSRISKYVVYYRDKNDTLTSGTVINSIRVEYIDGGTTETITDGGTTTTTDTTTVDGGTTDADTTTAATAATNAALQLNAGRTYNVLDGTGNNATLTNESGVDSNTERIEEQETPLASGADFAGDKKSEATVGLPLQAIIPIGAAVLCATLAILIVVMMRRRKNNGEQEA